MPGVDLEGYVTVPQRIAEFRAKHPEGRLRPVDTAKPFEVIEVGGRQFVVYIAAAYRDAEDALPGIGVAWEPFPGRTPYTKDSELMNAETSAWGRAIVAALAADTQKGIATAEEIRNREEERNAAPATQKAAPARTPRKPAESKQEPPKDLPSLITQVSSAKTVEALREAYKAVMNAGQLKTEIEIADESTGEKERMEFQQYLYRRSDALAHSKSAGAAAGEAGGEGGNR